MANNPGTSGGGGRGGLRPNSNTAPELSAQANNIGKLDSKNIDILSSPSSFYEGGYVGTGTGGGSTQGGQGGDHENRGDNGVLGAEGERGFGGPPGKNIIATNGLRFQSNVYTTNIAVPRIVNFYQSGNNSIEWTGKFLAPNTGNYKFQIISGDAGYVWLGPTAASGYTLANANANNGGLHTATSNEFVSYLTSGQSYDIRIQYSNRFNANGVVFKFGQLDNGAGNNIVTEQLYDTPGTHRWICPPGVTNVSVVCVGGGGGGLGASSLSFEVDTPADGASGGGGGGLGYKNNIVVVPGTAYTVVVGHGGRSGATPEAGGNSYFNTIATVMGLRGLGAGSGANAGGAGGTYVGDGGGNGAQGGGGNTGDENNAIQSGGGGGAGGYSGTGGRGADTTLGVAGSPTAGAGGAGGGGGSGNLNVTGIDPYTIGAGGGGVGVYGSGTSGNAGTNLVNSGVGATDLTTARTSLATGGSGGSGGQDGGAGGYSSWAFLYSVGIAGNADIPEYFFSDAFPILIPGLWPERSSTGGNYGGGAGGTEGGIVTYSTGGIGAVRIVWATGAAFPSTNVDQRIDLTTNGRGYYYADSGLTISGLQQKKYVGWFGNSASYFATATEYGATQNSSFARANNVVYTNISGGPTYVGYTSDSYAHATLGLSKATFNLAVPTGVQAGDIMIFASRLYVPSTNVHGDLWGGDSPAATQQDIEVWPATVNSQVGLYQNNYTGYFADNLSSLALSSANQNQTLAQVTVLDDRGHAGGNTKQWTGWFYPRQTGTYSFYLASDDAGYVWIGNNANTLASTTLNANINHSGTHGATVKGFSASFVANTFYQVRIISGNQNGTGQGEYAFYWKGPETGGANTKSLTSQNWYLTNTANTTLVPTFKSLDNVSGINVWANGNTGSMVVMDTTIDILNGTKLGHAFYKYKVADELDASGNQRYLMTTNFGGAVSIFAVRNVTTITVESPRIDTNFIVFDTKGWDTYKPDAKFDDYYKTTANQLSVGVMSLGMTANTHRLIGALTSNGFSTVEKVANNRESMILTTYKAPADNFDGVRFDLTALDNAGNTGSQFYQRFDFY